MTSRRRANRVAFLVGPQAIEIRELPPPVAAEGELVLAIDAALTCGTDLKVFRRGGHPRMMRPPCPFGHEVAGTVVASRADRFAPGDRVVVANSAPCGTCAACQAGHENLCPDLVYLNGAFADLLLVPARFAAMSTYPLPAGLACERAAAAEPLACVLHGLEVSAPAPASEVLVLGGGPIGLLFVAALARRGHRVTLADPHALRLETGRRLGAAATIEVRQGGSPDAAATSGGPGDGCDLAIDATGALAGWRAAVAAVRPGGAVTLFGGLPADSVLPLDATRLHYSEITVRGAYHHRPATFAAALELIADGLPVELLLSAERPLEGVEEALRSMQRREALKVVLRPGSDPL